MTTKHIEDETWKKVEQKTVKEIIRTGKSVKEGEMLKRLILIGLKHYDDEQDFSTIEKKTLNRRTSDDGYVNH